jgi:thioredoxin-related protein
MKSIILISCFALLTPILALSQNIKSIAIGTEIPMPGEKMQSVSGKKVSLDNVKTRRGLLVMFSCNTCPYVVRSQERTKEIVEYAGQQGIGMIIINSNEAQRDEDDSYKAMQEYAKKQGYTIPYVIDEKSKLADAFGATHTPQVFLFDGNGKLVYKGAMEDNPAKPAESKQIFLKEAIHNLVSDKPIDPNTTKSIGCSIKRTS